MSTLIRAIVAGLFATFAGSTTLAAQAHAPPPTAEDIADAMVDSTHGWFTYASDGRPASDSARRMAALALWDWEGGDRERGLRLLNGAYQRSVADSLFYCHAAFALTTVSRNAEAVAFAQTGIDRWPSFWLLWSVQADAFKRLGQADRAQVARATADSLRRTQGHL